MQTSGTSSKLNAVNPSWQRSMKMDFKSAWATVIPTVIMDSATAAFPMYPKKEPTASGSRRRRAKIRIARTLAPMPGLMRRRSGKRSVLPPFPVLNRIP